MTMKRFHFQVGGRQLHELLEHPAGDYVRYEDALSASAADKARIKRLEEALATLSTQGEGLPHTHRAACMAAWARAALGDSHE